MEKCDVIARKHEGELFSLEVTIQNGLGMEMPFTMKQQGCKVTKMSAEIKG